MEKRKIQFDDCKPAKVIRNVCHQLLQHVSRMSTCQNVSMPKFLLTLQKCVMYQDGLLRITMAFQCAGVKVCQQRMTERIKLK